ncbi:MAG: OmpA family protein [Candidatus Omnitrophica bacterium]|nr:OmpA family protein [Candidatus Omnitrophota bacterium]
MGKKKKQDESLEAPGYMMTYSVLMVLLMGFFIALSSLGTYGGEKFEKVAGSIQEAFDFILPKGGAGVMSHEMLLKGLGKPAVLKQRLTFNRSQLSAAVEKMLVEPGKDGAHDLRVDYTEEGKIRITVRNALLFTQGAADLTTAGQKLLDRLLRLLRDEPFEVEVAGISIVPSAVADARVPWENAQARAVSIVRYLYERGKIPYREVIAAGYVRPPEIGTEDAEINAVSQKIEVVLRPLYAQRGRKSTGG